MLVCVIRNEKKADILHKCADSLPSALTTEVIKCYYTYLAFKMEKNVSKNVLLCIMELFHSCLGALTPDTLYLCNTWVKLDWKLSGMLNMGQFPWQHVTPRSVSSSLAVFKICSLPCLWVTVVHLCLYANIQSCPRFIRGSGHKRCSLGGIWNVGIGGWRADSVFAMRT